MMLKWMRKLAKDRRGQGLLEYAFLIAGIAFICLVAVSVFGHKLSDQYAIAAGMLPGGHVEDNSPIAASEFVGTALDVDGNIVGNGQVSWQDITGVTTAGAQENNPAAVASGALTVTGEEAFIGD